MPKARELARELRKMADALDKEPNAPIVRAYLNFYHCGKEAKEAFVALAHALPHPLQKKYIEDVLRLEYDTSVMRIVSSIDRTAVCHLIEPAREAVYECDPILSDEECTAIGTE